MDTMKAMKMLNESEESSLAIQLDKDIKQLEKELADIRKSVQIKKNDAIANNPEFQELKAKKDSLEAEADELRQNYERVYRAGPFGDDWEIETDEKMAKQFEPKVKELYAQIDALQDQLKALYAKAKEETEIDTSDKEKELADKKKLSKANLSRLYAQEEAEIENISDILRQYHDIVSIDKASFKVADGNIVVDIVLHGSVEADEEAFDWDSDSLDYDEHYGERKAEEWAEDENLYPEDIAEQEGWVKEGDFFVIPGTNYKLKDDEEVRAFGEPSIANYYHDDGDYWNPPETDYDIEDSTIDLQVRYHFVKPIAEEELQESFFNDGYGELAWKLNQIISHMDNEEAYYGNWLYIWPDGEEYEDCLEDFKDKEDYDDLEHLFEKIYKAYHDDGLYKADEETIRAAHEWDKKLGLPEIDVL